jgi:hypothetical protein
MSDNRYLSDNFEAAEYNSLVAAINYEYCKKYGYEFIYYRPYLNKEVVELHNCIDPNSGELRHASWAKLLSAMRAHELNYDYIVYIDSDCIFKDFSVSIEEYIKNITEPLIFLNDKPWGETYPCAGFFILRVNEYSKQFIKNWFTFHKPDKNIIHAFEQCALYDIYTEYTIKLIDDWMFRETQGQFLRHIGTDQKELRVPYFKEYIEDNAINYLRNIKEIKIIDFNTVLIL